MDQSNGNLESMIEETITYHPAHSGALRLKASKPLFDHFVPDKDVDVYTHLQTNLFPELDF
jgi:hypothetical protein